MANLSAALNYAMSGLTNAGGLSALAARNVSNAENPDYSRRSAEIISLPGGGVSLSTISRSADKRLLEKLLESTSAASGQGATLEGLTRLGELVGDPASESSVAALLAGIQSRLRDFEANPASSLLAEGVVHAATSVVAALNAGEDEIQAIRRDADFAMGESVGRVNTLLSQFKIVNDAIVRGSGTAAELSDNLDVRDRVLKLLSEELGIRTMTRANNDIAIYTEGGITLFETSARRVAFTPSGAFAPGVTGGGVTVDGVGILGGGAAMASTSGRLPALAGLRDRVTVTVQSQFDEIARGLVAIFSESGQQDPALLPDAGGLFVDGANPAVAQADIATAGLAGRISVNRLAVPSLGGNPFLIRDGGFGGPAYVHNTANAASFQDRIGQLQSGFDAARSFDAGTGLGGAGSLLMFSASSSGWIEQRRAAADTSAEAGRAQQARAVQALLRKTGVNIDEEMAAILDLERSYQASSKIIAAVDAMLDSLMEAIR
jgi:flagellar hook-associated protein 1 FlgK